MLSFSWSRDPKCTVEWGDGGLYYKLFVHSDIFHLVRDMLIDDYPLRITGGIQ